MKRVIIFYILVSVTTCDIRPVYLKALNDRSLGLNKRLVNQWNCQALIQIHVVGCACRIMSNILACWYLISRSCCKMNTNDMRMIQWYISGLCLCLCSIFPIYWTVHCSIARSDIEIPHVFWFAWLILLSFTDSDQSQTPHQSNNFYHDSTTDTSDTYYSTTAFPIVASFSKYMKTNNIMSCYCQTSAK